MFPGVAPAHPWKPAEKKGNLDPSQRIDGKRENGRPPWVDFCGTQKRVHTRTKYIPDGGRAFFSKQCNVHMAYDFLCVWSLSDRSNFEDPLLLLSPQHLVTRCREACLADPCHSVQPLSCRSLALAPICTRYRNAMLSPGWLAAADSFFCMIPALYYLYFVLLLLWLFCLGLNDMLLWLCLFRFERSACTLFSRREST